MVYFWYEIQLHLLQYCMDTLPVVLYSVMCLAPVTTIHHVYITRVHTHTRELLRVCACVCVCVCGVCAMFFCYSVVLGYCKLHMLYCCVMFALRCAALSDELANIDDTHRQTLLAVQTSYWHLSIFDLR